jgi:hypothetical protein
MNQLAEKQITCPYCGETIDILIDSLERDQSYIEDCQVCCRPIEMKIFVDGAGQVSVQVSHEDE